MLKIIVPKSETTLFNNSTNEFIDKVLEQDTTICLEHSLVSISKWESKWHKPFLASTQKTNEEIIDYIKCMTITQNVDDIVYEMLTKENLKEINAYIENPMTATTFTDNRKGAPAPKNKEVLTSEVIYQWMVAYQIPFECQKWHLNRLITLIRVCNVKNSSKKMSKRETLMSNKAINEARRKRLNSNG